MKHSEIIKRTVEVKDIFYKLFIKLNYTFKNVYLKGL